MSDNFALHALQRAGSVSGHQHDVIRGRLEVVHGFQRMADEVLGSASLADTIGGKLVRVVSAPEDVWCSTVDSEMRSMRYRAMKCRDMWGIEVPGDALLSLEEAVRNAR